MVLLRARRWHLACTCSLTHRIERPAPGVARAITGLQDSPRKEDRIMVNLLKRLAREESAQGMAEYGLLVALIALAAIVTIGYVGTNLSSKFNTVATQIQANS